MSKFVRNDAGRYVLAKAEPDKATKAMCRYAKFCGKRMAHGDRANGCSDVDQQSCDPNHRGDTVTAPAGADDMPYRKCSSCYRTRTKREWESSITGARVCNCGSFSWVAVIE